MTPLDVCAAAGMKSLPINPISAAMALNIKVVNYETLAGFANTTSRNLYNTSPEGISFKYRGVYVIALNEKFCGERRRRFTAAHELGHIALGHIELPKITNMHEREADSFASELLAPLGVLEACGVNSPDGIERMCGISKSAAQITFSKLYRSHGEYKKLVQSFFRDYIIRYNSRRKI